MPSLPTPADVLTDPSAPSGVVSKINLMVQESYARQNDWGIYDQQAENFHLYLYGRTTNGAIRRYRMNLIQSACIANAAIQVGDRPKIKINPRESGEPATCFINTTLPAPIGPMGEDIRNSVRPECFGAHSETLQPIMPQPLNDDEYGIVKTLYQQSQAARTQAIATGQPEPLGLLPDGYLVEVNDFIEAQATQTLFDEKADASNFSRYIVENQLYCGVLGHQFLLVEFDDDEQRFYFRNPENACVYVDPYKTDIRDCQYAVLDEFLGLEEAQSLYPELSAKLEQYAVQGPPTKPGQVPNAMPQPWYQSNFGRKVVILRTAWIRNQPYPLTPDAAVAAGHVGVYDLSASQVPNDPATSLDPQPGAGADQSGAGEPPAPPTGLLLHTASGDPDFAEGPVDHTHAKWPVRRGLRQIRMLGSELVDDRECERVNIPLGHNVNIPILYTPFGQGEPERLEPLQRAYNNTLTDITTHGDFAAFPTNLVPRSVAEAHPQLAQNKYTEPGKTYVVEDRLFTLFNGQPISQLKPGEMPADAWKREQTLFQRFNDGSDQSDVMRGQAPTATSSNALAVTLTQAAKTSITFKSGRLEDMLSYVAKVMIGDIALRLRPEDMAQMVKKYPLQVWYELHRRIQSNAMDVDLSVEIASNNSGQQQKNNVIAAAQGGAPISPQSVIEAVGKDPDTEAMQTLQWQAKMRAGQAAVPGAAPQQAAPNPPPPQA